MAPSRQSPKVADCILYNREEYDESFSHCVVNTSQPLVVESVSEAMEEDLPTAFLPREIQELEDRDALREKQIQDLTEQKQKASSDPSQTARTPVKTTKKPATQATPSPADCRDLYEASKAGNLEKVKRLLSRGVDVDCRWRGRTPVIGAAWYGHRDVVELLVGKGADVSLVDKDGDNILHFACRGGDLETVEFVLSLNAVDIDARTNYGRTAAHLARRYRYTRVADLLVSRGAQ
ncbi:ankyrin repeat and protein kinase domain-containing protein 1-like isoform X2 [Haliotis rufescens]|uniref:ankyrin repeat and protein kinase domain-containing protein 1-like isoform X2 n=1 Tax=Haliotis rufescens TaxID=6454 RepID=UPI00201F2F51|nr:ankyrin repeat and protein kinase domain-containing protein 1-like isoform X2 [Haliotis rufescens]